MRLQLLAFCLECMRPFLELEFDVFKRLLEALWAGHEEDLRVDPRLFQLV